MKTKSLFLILFILGAVMAIAVGSSCGQDIDISGMSNTQLMELLQQIVQELGSGPAAEPTEIAVPTMTPTPVPMNITEPSVDLPDDYGELLLLLQQINDKLSTYPEAGTPEPEMKAAPFSIYENKKLMLERIPDDRFIQNNNDGDNNDKGTPKKPSGPTAEPTVHPECKPGYHMDCWYTIIDGRKCGCVKN